ncbi:tetratricopeptide repeat protein [Actinoplanes sp. CA-142083]|uniref:tetratricopeptide repeat protein n=1 Tax=Actinoplanes sp. CA-142083 TaxID=3239903 RepID=UPI003D923ACB
MGRDVWVGHNEGIISTGDYATNTMNRIEPGRISPADEVAAPAGLVGLFHADALFVGRAAELNAVTAALEHDNGVITQAITGLGGIGKSTLARRYALTQRERYNPIWWLTAETPARLDAGLAALARRLHPELGGHPDETAVPWCRDWLDAHDGWLLVLDNVSRPSDVAGILAAHTRGRFLVTSRQTEGWAGLAVPTRLEVLSTAQARELFDGLVADERLRDGADELCAALGGLPLAIEMAGAYLVQNDVTARDHLERLTRSGDAWSWVPAGEDPQRTVGRVWQVTFDRIEAEHGPEPGALLRAMAWYAPEDIPFALLDDDREAVGRLASYGLVTRDEDAVAVHRLVQAVNRTAAPDGWQNAGAGLESAWHAARTWTQRERLAAHLDTAITRLTGLADRADALALAAHLADLLLDLDGSRARAGELIRAVLAVHERLLGSTHPEVIDTRTVHARVFTRLGREAQAISLLEAIAAEAVRANGRRNPATVHARVRLALAYIEAGEDEKAIELCRRTIPDAVKAVGPDHRYTTSLRFHLVQQCREIIRGYASPVRKGRAAITGWRQLEALKASFERIDEPGGESVLECLDRMVGFLELIGQLGNAIAPCEELLYWSEIRYGPDAADTVVVRAKLAELHLETGHPERAAPVYEEIAAGDEVDYWQLLEALDGLGRAHLAAGDTEAAADAFERGVAARAEVKGPDDDATLGYLNDVAEAFVEARLPALALPWYERFAAARERLGSPPYASLPARNNVAVVLAKVGDFDRARELLEELLPAYREHFGGGHPATATVEESLRQIGLATADVGKRTRGKWPWRATMRRGGPA